MLALCTELNFCTIQIIVVIFVRFIFIFLNVVLLVLDSLILQINFVLSLFSEQFHDI